MRNRNERREQLRAIGAAAVLAAAVTVGLIALPAPDQAAPSGGTVQAETVSHAAEG